MNNWHEWDALGRRDGYVRCRCPVCGFEVMVSVFEAVTAAGEPKAAGGWPRCLVCPGSRGTRPRVEPLHPLDGIRRLAPGVARNATQLKRDGCVVPVAQSAP